MARAVDTSTIDPDTVRESIEHIAANLRPADLAELRATVGSTEDPFWPLFEGMEQSTTTFLILDSTSLPIGIMGVAPHITAGVGIAWLMGTEGVEREALSIARQTRRYVAELHQDYPILWANVDARNELSMKWLEWSGFTIADADPAWGPEERLFLQFARAK